ncbi:TOBE domain-containing protein [Fulvivirga sedimenti]|jgi:molybdopterin-binding protein|uniref:TOBE domain-containing protein n=1 Tax=Fulvivirga sedimenti TaxID=2879465 RepID=A0A9X1HM24_9BACT|nr:TOBE domain-containing protein [Fulvivirga sedimenti]MCA6073495.1 TOBE domain-containing protein [Fulvivirga sedimenti]
MNRIQATITEVSSSGNLSIVKLAVAKIPLSAVILDTIETSPFVQVGNLVSVLFKETEVTIADITVERISLRNRFPGEIVEIETGKLLTRLQLKTDAGMIRALITTESANELQLAQGSEVVAMIKTNELMLSE